MNFLQKFSVQNLRCIVEQISQKLTCPKVVLAPATQVASLYDHRHLQVVPLPSNRTLSYPYLLQIYHHTPDHILLHNAKEINTHEKGIPMKFSRAFSTNPKRARVFYYKSGVRHKSSIKELLCKKLKIFCSKKKKEKTKPKKEIAAKTDALETAEEEAKSDSSASADEPHKKDEKSGKEANEERIEKLYPARSRPITFSELAKEGIACSHGKKSSPEEPDTEVSQNDIRTFPKRKKGSKRSITSVISSTCPTIKPCPVLEKLKPQNRFDEPETRVIQKDQVSSKEKKSKDVCKNLKALCAEAKKAKGTCKTEARVADKDPCKKKDDSCRTQKDPCKKTKSSCSDPCAQTEDPCKKTKSSRSDPCAQTKDPCKKTKSPCSDPCAQTKDPCKKSKSSCSDPCAQTEYPCKKTKSPCSDPCAKTEDPCKKTKSPVRKPCAQTEDSCKKSKSPCREPCAQTEDPCKKPKTPCSDPCAQTEDPCKKTKSPCSDPYAQTEDPCKAKKLSTCKISKKHKRKKVVCSKKSKKVDVCSRKRKRVCNKKIKDPCKKSSRSKSCSKKKRVSCSRTKSRKDICKKRRSKSRSCKRRSSCRKTKSEEDTCSKRGNASVDPCKRAKSNKDICKKRRRSSSKSDSCKKSCTRKRSKSSSKRVCRKRQRSKSSSCKKARSKDSVCRKRSKSKSRSNSCRRSKSRQSLCKDHKKLKRRSVSCKRRDPCKKAKSDENVCKRRRSRSGSSRRKRSCKKSRSSKSVDRCRKPRSSSGSCKQVDPCKRAKSKDSVCKKRRSRSRSDSCKRKESCKKTKSSQRNPCKKSKSKESVCKSDPCKKSKSSKSICRKSKSRSRSRSCRKKTKSNKSICKSRRRSRSKSGSSKRKDSTKSCKSVCKKRKSRSRSASCKRKDPCEKGKGKDNICKKSKKSKSQSSCCKKPTVGTKKLKRECKKLPFYCPKLEKCETKKKVNPCIKEKTEDSSKSNAESKEHKDGGLKFDSKPNKSEVVLTKVSNFWQKYRCRLRIKESKKPSTLKGNTSSCNSNKEAISDKSIDNKESFKSSSSVSKVKANKLEDKKILHTSASNRKIDPLRPRDSMKCTALPKTEDTIMHKRKKLRSGCDKDTIQRPNPGVGKPRSKPGKNPKPLPPCGPCKEDHKPLNAQPISQTTTKKQGNAELLKNGIVNLKITRNMHFGRFSSLVQPSTYKSTPAMDDFGKKCSQNLHNCFYKSCEKTPQPIPDPKIVHESDAFQPSNKLKEDDSKVNFKNNFEEEDKVIKDAHLERIPKTNLTLNGNKDDVLVKKEKRQFALNSLIEKLLINKVYPSEIKAKWKNIFQIVQTKICETEGHQANAKETLWPNIKSKPLLEVCKNDIQKENLRFPTRLPFLAQEREHIKQSNSSCRIESEKELNWRTLSHSLNSFLQKPKSEKVLKKEQLLILWKTYQKSKARAERESFFKQMKKTCPETSTKEVSPNRAQLQNTLSSGAFERVVKHTFKKMREAEVQNKEYTEYSTVTFSNTNNIKETFARVRFTGNETRKNVPILEGSALLTSKMIPLEQSISSSTFSKRTPYSEIQFSHQAPLPAPLQEPRQTPLQKDPNKPIEQKDPKTHQCKIEPNAHQLPITEHGKSEVLILKHKRRGTDNYVTDECPPTCRKPDPCKKEKAIITKPVKQKKTGNKPDLKNRSPKPVDPVVIVKHKVPKIRPFLLHQPCKCVKDAHPCKTDNPCVPCKPSKPCQRTKPTDCSVKVKSSCPHPKPPRCIRPEEHCRKKDPRPVGVIKKCPLSPKDPCIKTCTTSSEELCPIRKTTVEDCSRCKKLEPCIEKTKLINKPIKCILKKCNKKKKCGVYKAPPNCCKPKPRPTVDLCPKCPPSKMKKTPCPEPPKEKPEFQKGLLTGAICDMEKCKKKKREKPCSLISKPDIIITTKKPKKKEECEKSKVCVTTSNLEESEEKVHSEWKAVTVKVKRNKMKRSKKNKWGKRRYSENKKKGLFRTAKDMCKNVCSKIPGKKACGRNDGQSGFNSDILSSYRNDHSPLSGGSDDGYNKNSENQWKFISTKLRSENELLHDKPNSFPYEFCDNYDECKLAKDTKLIFKCDRSGKYIQGYDNSL